jgi:hypothetical protein
MAEKGSAEKKISKKVALREEREKQLQVAKDALERLQKEAREARDLSARRVSLTEHLRGFYEEVDKLTKGKALIEATPLIVDQANEIINDAKGIVKDDVHLNRVKPFFPAGNNPVYPDVLVVMRVVLEGLKRAARIQEHRSNRIAVCIARANTAAIALEYFLEDENAEISKEEVKWGLDGAAIDDSSFAGDYTGKIFDFGRLDSRDLKEFFSADFLEGASSEVPEDEE